MSQVTTVLPPDRKSHDVDFWYPRLRRGLKLLEHAWKMYQRQKNADSRTVLFYGIQSIENGIAVGIDAMGGMAGEW